MKSPLVCTVYPIFKNVYFIDRETFFGTEDRHYCTSDLIHPNDLGMYRMAKTIYHVLKEILEK